MAPKMILVNALAVAMAVSPAAAAIKGFNYGATYNDGTIKVQSDYENEFKTAKGLVGAEDFTSARLYTMIQGSTTATPISAIPAAIAQNTTLLLGLWCSGDTFDNEITALTAAIKQYGDDLTNLVVGISVGSEDLYRNSEAGIKAKAGVGKQPTDIVSDIKTVRSTISGTVLSDVPVGHVDTWTAWANSSNDAVIDAVDWLGLDAYPYFQNTQSNAISSGKGLFQDAVNNVNAAAGGKPLWVTETGWPVSGDTENLAVANTANAKTYWDEVGCDMLFDQVNTWWYILQDAAGSTPSPSFGIVGSELTTTPLYNLTCPAVSSSTSSSASSSATSPSSKASNSASGTTTPSSATATPSPSALKSASSGAASGTGSATDSASGSASGTATGVVSGAASSSGATTSLTSSASSISASISNVLSGSATATGTPVPGSVSNSTATGSSGVSGSTGTSAVSSPSVTPYTGAASSVSASVTGIVAVLFAAIIAF